MISEIDHDEISIEPFGVRCEVPEHPVAKIMFYLHCLAALGYDMPSRFTNFERFTRLSDSDVDDVVTVAKKLDPDFLISQRVVLVNNKLAMGEMNNRLYKLKGLRARGRFSSDECDGATLNLSEYKILVVGTDFLRHYYYDPLEDLSHLHDDDDLLERLFMVLSDLR